MLKLFKPILSASRKCRSFAVGVALRLLRAVRDAEKDESCPFSDKLDEFDLTPENISSRCYTVAEDDCLNSEEALAFLDSAIEDPVFAYGGRF
jgi:hypothetical protein